MRKIIIILASLFFVLAVIGMVDSSTYFATQMLKRSNSNLLDYNNNDYYVDPSDENYFNGMNRSLVCIYKVDNYLVNMSGTWDEVSLACDPGWMATGGGIDLAHSYAVDASAAVSCYADSDGYKWRCGFLKKNEGGGGIVWLRIRCCRIQ